VKTCCVIVVIALAGAAFAGVGEWDPNMAEKTAVVSNDVKWIDGKYLPIEGRAFDDTEHYYDRLPANVTTNVNGGVRAMKHHTSGMLFRFESDSPFVTFQWRPYSDTLSEPNMAAPAVSGVDVYVWEGARWRYRATGMIWNSKTKVGGVTVNGHKGARYIMNLPLYNGIRWCRLGISPKATVKPFPHTSGVEKPVVFYGTSITQGGCASRPGLGFVNWVGRRLDVPVVGLGFAGCGKMEYEMSEHLARIDASCYVIDCVWNVKGAEMKARLEPFVRNLRAKRPDVPIVFAEGGSFEFVPRKDDDPHARIETQEIHQRAVYEKLVAEGWKKLFFLSKNGMYDDSFEGSMDRVHPNDLGMKTMTDAFAKAVREALGLKE